MTFCFFRERLTIYSKSSKIKLLGLNAILSCNYDNIGYCCIVGGGNRDMSNMQDIADKAGVSRATVSRVLSDHPSVKAATRKKVLHWVKELGYEPNLIAQSLAGNSTNIIGVIVPEIAYPFFSEIIEAIESQAFYEGYSVIICNTNRSLEKEKIY